MNQKCPKSFLAKMIVTLIIFSITVSIVASDTLIALKAVSTEGGAYVCNKFNRLPESVKCVALASGSLVAICAAKKTFDWSIEKADICLAHLGLREEKELPDVIQNASFFSISEDVHTSGYRVQFFEKSAQFGTMLFSQSFVYESKPSAKEIERLQARLDPRAIRPEFKRAYVNWHIKLGPGTVLFQDEESRPYVDWTDYDTGGFNAVSLQRYYPSDVDIKTNSDIYPKEILDTLKQVEREPVFHLLSNPINTLFYPYVEKITYDEQGKVHKEVSVPALLERILQVSGKIACLTAIISLIRCLRSST